LDTPRDRINKIADLPPNERPQERLEALGAQSLSDRELLAIMLRSGTAQKDILEIADDLICDAHSLAGLLRWDVTDFQKVKGIGKIKALQLSVLIEISRRIMQKPRVLNPPIDDPFKVWEILRLECRYQTIEKVWVLCLDRKNKLIKLEEVTSGTATGSMVHSREVFRPAIRHGCTAVILAHNHPIGDPTPSASDLKVTKKISEAAQLIDIEFHDHVIIGEIENCPHKVGYYSFANAGLI